MSKVDWILGQTLFWVMVVIIVVTGMVGIRRSGAVLAAHQAALVGGRAAGSLDQGRVQAGSDLSAWWGRPPAETGRTVEVIADPGRRSVIVRVQGTMRVLFGYQADLGAGSFQRWEGFYPGPPDEFE